MPTSAAAGVPVSLPVVVLNATHEGLPVMAKVNVLDLASEALGWNVYTSPTTAWVPGVPEMVGGVGGVSTRDGDVECGQRRRVRAIRHADDDAGIRADIGGAWCAHELARCCR